MAAARRAGAPASGRVLAGIDIGTNTVRLLAVAPQPDGSWRIVDEARRITRLGEGATPGRTLQAAAIQRTIAAAGEFAERARRAQAGVIRVVATSAVREAVNQADFVEAARRDRRLAGIAPRVIDAAEEARLTLAGVARAVDFRAGLSLIVDIGGGSTEFTLTEGDRLVASTSCLLGVVGLTETHLTTAPTDAREYAGLLAAIDAQLDAVARALAPRRAARLIGTAGTITTLAALHLGLVAYDAATINATRLTLARVQEILVWLKSLSLPERQAIAALEAGREDIIVSGAAIVARIMERFEFPELLVSDYGLREGLICAMVAEMTAGSG
ncbi:MAG: Ppx/GppA family phosphatase [Candidatus Tectomicrobia bacterium]|nr:Ppx/GppA family phosphatase [Candidatus Tectomicrobia bacterium]